MRRRPRAACTTWRRPAASIRRCSPRLRPVVDPEHAGDHAPERTRHRERPLAPAVVPRRWMLVHLQPLRLERLPHRFHRAAQRHRAATLVDRDDLEAVLAGERAHGGDVLHRSRRSRSRAPRATASAAPPAHDRPPDRPSRVIRTAAGRRSPRSACPGPRLRLAGAAGQPLAHSPGSPHAVPSVLLVERSEPRPWRPAPGRRSSHPLTRVSTAFLAIPMLAPPGARPPGAQPPRCRPGSTHGARA